MPYKNLQREINLAGDIFVADSILENFNYLSFSVFVDLAQVIDEIPFRVFTVTVSFALQIDKIHRTIFLDTP